MASLHHNPFFGSGWRLLIVNEADIMTPGAAAIWLDALEALPPRSVIVFTTNAPGRIPARLRDRCERLGFESSALLLRPALQELAARVWRQELGRDDCPPVEHFGRLADENGNASFRRLLQQMTPFVRAGTVPVPAPEKKEVDRGAAARKAWATRRRAKQQQAKAS
jgi:DNA polymerase-3 subunit delta'